MSYRKNHIQPQIRKLRKHRSIFKMRWFWVAVLMAAMVIVMVCLVLFLPVLQVTVISISGNEKVQVPDIENIIWDDINKLPGSSRSILLVNTGKLATDVMAAFPDAESVAVQKRLFHAITVSIKERTAVAVFCSQRVAVTCFLIDDNGVIFSPLQNPPQDLMTINNESIGKTVAIGKQAVDKDMMEAVLKIQKILKNNFQVDIKKMQNGNPLVVTTGETWDIYFNPDGDLNLQITKMNALLKDQITPAARKNLQYIYLQYSDRAYYR